VDTFSMVRVETKYGVVGLRYAMIEIDDHNLEEGIEVSLDDEYLGAVFNTSTFDVDEFSLAEVEEIVEEFI
jgi:hypothetical protein